MWVVFGMGKGKKSCYFGFKCVYSAGGQKTDSNNLQKTINIY